MSDEEIEALIQVPDEALHTDYKEMLAGRRKDPKNRIWYAPWRTMRKGDLISLGDLGFKGPPRKKAVEIGYGILKEHEGKGYTTEAVQAMAEWAGTNFDE